MNDCKIELSNGRCFGLQQLLANSIENFISHEKKSVVTAGYLQSIKTFLTLELSQYRKSGSTFSSSEPVAALSNCHQLGIALCLCLPVLPTQAVLECCPKSFILQSNSFGSDCQMTCTGW